MDENELRCLQHSERLVKEAEQLVFEIMVRSIMPIIQTNKGESTCVRNPSGLTLDERPEESLRLTLGSPDDPRTADQWRELES